MSHDPTKVLLGGRISSIADITCEEGDPTVFKAGTAVRRSSSGALLLADNGVSPLIGVSVGGSLTPGDIKKTSVMRIGNDVPLLLQDGVASLVVGDLTFTSIYEGVPGNDITVSLVDTGSISVVVNVLDIVINIDDGVSTANAIKAAVDGNPTASALVSVTVAGGQGAVAQDAASEAPLAGGTSFDPVIGSVVRIDDATGKASAGGDVTSATYTSGRKTGVYPDGTTAACCLIELIGGF